jgi:hypothetical protein
MWSIALEEFVSDDVLSSSELEYLGALRRLLNLGEDDIVEIERRLVHPRFHKVIADVLSDETVSLQERDRLARLGSALRLSPDLQKRAYHTAATRLLKEMLDRSVEDRRLSPTEQADLSAAVANLGVDLDFRDINREELSYFALLWRIENGDLPSLPTSVSLERGETCYFKASASWHETRKAPSAIADVSSRIARGFYYRLGRSRPRNIPTDDLVPVDVGKVYFTNRRILFNGLNRESTIKLGTILSFQVFADGLIVERKKGRSPYLMIEGDAEAAAIILSRLLAGSIKARQVTV